MSDDRNIPDGYFREFGERLEGRIAMLEDNVEKHAPLLSSLKGLQAYKVPPGYFDELSEKISLRMSRRTGKRWLRPAAMAAVLIILVTAGWFGLRQKQAEPSAIAETEIYDYYIYNIDILDQPVIYDLAREAGDAGEIYLENLSEDELELYEEILIDELAGAELLDIL